VYILPQKSPWKFLCPKTVIYKANNNAICPYKPKKANRIAFGIRKKQCSAISTLFKARIFTALKYCISGKPCLTKNSYIKISLQNSNIPKFQQEFCSFILSNQQGIIIIIRMTATLASVYGIIPVFGKVWYLPYIFFTDHGPIKGHFSCPIAIFTVHFKSFLHLKFQITKLVNNYVFIFFCFTKKATRRHQSQENLNRLALYKVASIDHLEIPNPNLHIYLAGLIERTNNPNKQRTFSRFVIGSLKDLEQAIEQCNTSSQPDAIPYLLSRHTADYATIFINLAG